MRAATCSSAPPCSKGFQAFWASSACQPSATSYHSCSAAPLPWPSGFSWAAPCLKAGRSLLAFGSNSAVKPTRIRRPLTLLVSPFIFRFMQASIYSSASPISQRFLLWGFGAAPGFACLHLRKFQAFLASGARLVKRHQLSFLQRCAASVAQRFFMGRARLQGWAPPFGLRV